MKKKRLLININIVILAIALIIAMIIFVRKYIGSEDDLGYYFETEYTKSQGTSIDDNNILDDINFKMLLKNELSSEELKVYCKEDKNILFLPTFVGNDIRIEYNNDLYKIFDSETKKEISSNEYVKVKNKESISIDIESKDGSIKHHIVIKLMQSSNLDTIFIDTKSSNMDYLHMDKNNKETGNISIVDESGELIYGGDLSSISVRGNSTFYYPKKAYSITLDRVDGLLGMSDAREWVLLANHPDEAYIRNKLTQDIAKTLDVEYIIESKFVDLYLNGEYAGNYQLSEKVTEIPITEKFSDNQILCEIDHLTHEMDSNVINLAVEENCVIHYPKDLSKEEREQIINKLASIESALSNEEGVDGKSKLHYTEMIDINSMVKKYLIDEVTYNFDAWRGSNYIYTNKEGMLCFGPVWDYDYSFGNAVKNQNSHNTTGIKAGERGWFEQVYLREEFRMELMDMFNQKLLPFYEKELPSLIEHYKNEINKSVEMDYLRWGKGNKAMAYRGFESNIDYLKHYIDKRIEYLDDVWNNGEIYYEVRFMSNDKTLRYDVKKGECLAAPICNEEGFDEWIYPLEERLVYDEKHPIFEDVLVVATYKEEKDVER